MTAYAGFQRQHQKALEEYIAEHGDEEEDAEEEEEEEGEDEDEDEGEAAASIRQGAGDEADPQAGSNGQHTEASTQGALQDMRAAVHRLVDVNHFLHGCTQCVACSLVDGTLLPPAGSCQRSSSV